MTMNKAVPCDNRQGLHSKSASSHTHSCAHAHTSSHTGTHAHHRIHPTHHWIHTHISAVHLAEHSLV
ncbi:hypothetical protein SISSUDRAFT_719781 [Sistotremastrum suecicum HHB10207 ss-3]|uniref:Uncharacterized protein n=1 Tax=Sistotremastrum suecicum HHB10207 ss-3 TaxID=1314776 RepID=A0A166DNK7_9AGAM|nr:hypothetical protein SISSUDRAFT_719781 [Sistotremastrum suecicum HHB10207 ss-3]